MRKDEKEDNDEIDMGSDDNDRDELEEKLNEETGYSYRLDKEFNIAYAKYLIETKKTRKNDPERRWTSEKRPI